jgi:acyl-CoA synthetase (AMP-forming)/AMP-acid ligase II
MTTAVMARFDLDVYLNCIQTVQPEELAAVPPIILLLVKDPRVEKYDLSSVRKILSAAAPLSKELAEALEGRFRKLYGTTVYCHQSWGLTETSPLATGVPPERMVDKRHTVGCITPNMQFRFIDPETMQDVDMTIQDNGQLPLAEILCRGPNVTKGYLGNESATKDLFHVDSNGDKWMRTGDIATIDQDGYITIHDRIKEMIKYKGLQVIPSELEGKLLEYPDVDDCGVTSRYVEDQATELPVAFVVLTSQARSQPLDAVATNLDRWINERVANHKRLRGGIQFIDAIPKSPSGKILRRKLKELATRNRATSKL